MIKRIVAFTLVALLFAGCDFFFSISNPLVGTWQNETAGTGVAYDVLIFHGAWGSVAIFENKSMDANGKELSSRDDREYGTDPDTNGDGYATLIIYSGPHTNLSTDNYDYMIEGNTLTIKGWGTYRKK
jgi:hypothetical protein